MSGKALSIRYNKLMAAYAEPFIKWAGGKRSLLSDITPHIPAKINTFTEGFLGGGAVFWHARKLAAQGDISVKEWVINDYNGELITTYISVRDKLPKLIKRIEEHEKAFVKCHAAATEGDRVDIKVWNNKTRKVKSYPSRDEYFYKVRDSEPTDPVEVAARFIFLNRTCFNGLYRVNPLGRFNVPAGKSANGSAVEILNISRLNLCSAELQGVTIMNGSYALAPVEKNDWIYLDPPYDVWNSNSFTSYTDEDFSWDDQVSLKDWAKAATDAGARVLLSNHSTPRINELYKGKPFAISEIDVRRSINSKGDGRGAVKEVLISGHPV